MNITIKPDDGPIQGGTTVEISVEILGLDWETLDSLVVKFDGTLATDIEVTEYDYKKNRDKGTITVTSPPGQHAGKVEIIATTLGGQCAKATFSYQGGEITSVTPNKATVAEGSKILVTINGSQFNEVKWVKFGGNSASHRPVSENEIWAQVPVSSVKPPQAVSVSVQTKNELITLNNAFTYQ
jgi:IPT/TIG domain